MQDEAVIYTRVSSKKQLKDGHGNDSQEQLGMNFAQANQWKLLQSFKEPGITGTTTKRPAMEEMMAFLKQRHHQGKETIVIIDDLKRFARDMGAYLELKELVISCGARLRSPNLNLADQSPEGEFMELLFVLTGQLERKQNRRQVIDKMKARLERGYWCFPDTIPGLKYVRETAHGKIMRRHEPEASIYTEALEGFASGRFANQGALKAFLEFRLGKTLTIQSARNTLDRAAVYAGFIQYDKWGVTRRKGHHDALISVETYLRIRERLDGSMRKNTRKDINPEFPLRGRIQCTKCNRRLRAAWCTGRHEKYAKYWCANNQCPLYSVTAKRIQVEGDFEKILQLIKPQERTLEAVKRRSLRRWQKKLDEVTHYHQSITSETKSLAKQVQDLADRAGATPSKIVAAAYEKRVEDLELARLALVEKQGEYEPDNFDYQTALDEVIKFIENPYERWQSGILAEQHLVLDICFVNDLEYHPKEGYQTAQLSPTFDALTQYNAVLDPSSETQVLGCGHGGS